MAEPSQRFINHSFFLSPGIASEVLSKVGAKRVFVDVGGNGDCGFRAIAAGLLDYFLMHPRMNGELLNKVLSSHFSYFPTHRTTMPGLVKASERMERLIKQVRMTELLPAMAYTLRQLAVTELCENPALYRGAFIDRHETTTPEEMRKPTTWIDESSIAALARALAMPIEVQIVERV